MLLQSSFYRDFDAGAFLSLAALGGDLIDARGRPRRRIRLLQPLLQQRLQFTHVLEAQLERLEPADGGLRENVSIQGSEREPYVSLRKTQLDASLLELFRERFQVVGRGRVLFASGRITAAGSARVAGPAASHVVRVMVMMGRRHVSGMVRVVVKLDRTVVLHLSQGRVQLLRVVMCQHTVHCRVVSRVVLQGRRGASATAAGAARSVVGL